MGRRGCGRRRRRRLSRRQRRPWAAGRLGGGAAPAAGLRVRWRGEGRRRRLFKEGAARLGEGGASGGVLFPDSGGGGAGGPAWFGWASAQSGAREFF